MPNGTDTVRVQAPDGRIGSIPRSQYQQAAAKGYTLAKTKYEKQQDVAAAPWTKLTSGAGFDPSNILQNILSAGKGMWSATKDVFNSPVIQGKDSLLNKYGLDPARQQFERGQQEIKAGDRVAGNINKFLGQNVPFVGPFIGDLGEQVRKGDVGGAVAKAATYEIAPKVVGKVAGAATKYALGVPEFIRNGQEGAVTHAVGRLDGAMAYTKPKIEAAVKNMRGEIGAHAQAIVDADEMPGRKPGIPVNDFVKKLDESGNELRAAAQSMPKLDKILKQIENIGIHDPIEMQRGGETVTVEQYAPFNVIKQLRTDMGSAMTDLRDAGKFSEAKILGDGYKSLTEKMAARSKELGMTPSFIKYNKLNESLRNMLDEGPIGDALKQDTGLKFFKKIRESGEQVRLQDHLNGLKKYGFDVGDFRRTLGTTKQSYGLASGASNSYLRYLGTKIAGGAALSAVGVPHGFMFGMAAGLLGPKYAAALGELGTPMGKFGGSLDALRAGRTAEGPTPVSQAIAPPPPPPPPAPRAVPPPSPLPPPSPQAILESRVPLELRPSPGESPMLNMLQQLQREVGNPNASVDAVDRMILDAKKEFAKARAKYRVQEAMQEHRPKTKEAEPAKPKAEQKAAAAPTQPLTVKGFSQVTKSVSPAEAADRAQMKVYEKQMNVWIDKKSGARSQERYKEYDAKFQDAKKKYYAIADKYADADEEKEVIAAVPREKESPTAVFDTLKPEDQEWIRMWAKEIKHLPQALREAEMSELNKYGHKGSLLKERIAMQHVDKLKNPLPPEPGSTEAMGGATGEAMQARMQQEQQRYERRASSTRAEREY